MKMGKTLSNLVWNFSGQAVPVLVAFVTMPLLIQALGAERFGILALGWLVTGYFSLFDFGVGRVTTRWMALLHKNKQPAEHASVFWNSVYVHTALGLLGGFVFLLAVPWLVTRAFALPVHLHDEARQAFGWLAFSIPALVLTCAFRGALESEQRFDLVNAVKLPSSALNYLLPLLTLQWSTRVDWVIAAIALTRWAVLVAYAVLCTRALVLTSGQRKVVCPTMAHLLCDGGWLTVASLIAPLMMAMDRLFIAQLASLQAVTYYVVAYEVITKLWIFSSSVLGVAFPLMSMKRGPELRALSHQALYGLGWLTTPVVCGVLVFGYEMLNIWMGPVVASQSTPVLQCLALGVWLNVLAQVPQTTLQAAGRSDVVGKLQLIELPLYAVLAWLLISQFGILGAALAWTIRAFLDAVVLTILLSFTLPGFKRWPWKGPS